ncbi:MAG TPA: BamA/TamA family outer membrane protein [Bacteroidia bacterium]|nr:BamA/TamA family outer membrane protein [Bacteroidia bacterium]
MNLRRAFLFITLNSFLSVQAQVPDSLLPPPEQPIKILPLPDVSSDSMIGAERPDSNLIDQLLNQRVIVKQILLVGNKITKQSIITRELIFHQGDTVSRYVLQDAMKRSRENLLNTSLFNFVEIYDQPDANDSSETFVIVRMTERWYLFPLPIFELVDRNFNEWWLTKDFSRTNYGAYIVRENFLGRKQSLQLLVRLGYSQKLGLYYSIPYINKKQQDGLSFSFSFTRNHEISYGDSSNKTLFFKDEDVFIRKQFSSGIRLTHRSGIHDYYSYLAEYQDNTIADTVVALNSDYFLHGTNEEKLITLSFVFSRDHRDFKIYPLKGYYFDFSVTKQGLGILKDEPDLLSLSSSVRKFWELSPRWHFAAGVKGKLSGQSFAPYYNSRGLGYGNDFVRGYEYYVINGQNYAVFKSNIKFTLIPEKVVHIKFVPLEKFNRIPFAFYLNVFADMGYAKDRQFYFNNPLANSFLFGTGLGLDYVTYYDMVFRLEYSYNKSGEHGVFLHFVSPIW